MIKYQVRVFLLPFFIGLLATLAACRPSTEPPNPSPNPNPDPNPNPGNTVVVSSLFPVRGGSGTSVTIAGNGFSTNISEDTVWINGVRAAINQATATQLMITIPDGAGTGSVVVSSKGTRATGPQFTYELTYQVYTVAGNYTQGNQDGIGSSARFAFIWALAADTIGNIFVADGSNNMIRKVTPDGVVTTYAGAGSSSSSYGAGTFFYQPNGVAVDKNGIVYVTDTYRHNIKKVTAPETVIHIAGASTHGDFDATGSFAYFHSPCALVTDNIGNVFVVDQMNHKIKKISPAGEVTSFAGGGYAQPGFANGTGSAARFSSPNGIAIDRNNNLYVADLGNFMIRKITPTGEVTTLAGSTGGFADGAGNTAKFGFLSGIAVDTFGNIYVADNSNNRIRKITSGGTVSTLAGKDIAGTTNGNVNIATFTKPYGLTIDKDGIIYVSDGQLSSSIRKIMWH